MRKIGLAMVLLAAVVILLPSFATNDKKLSTTYQKLLEDKFYAEWKKGVDSGIEQIQNLQIQVGDLNDWVSRWSGSFEELSTNYSTVSSNLDTLWDRVSRLEGEFENSQYQSKFADLSNRMDKLDSRFGNFKNLEFDELSQRVDQLRSRFDTLRYKMESIDQQLRSIEDISYRLDNVERQLNDFERWHRDIESWRQDIEYRLQYCCGT